MRIRKLTCAALCLLLVCAAIGGAYADDTPKGYYKMWSDQSNTVTIDGVTYYDVYGDRKVRPDVTNTSGDAGFFKDVLKNKKIEAGGGMSPLEIWRTLSDRIAYTYPTTFMIDGSYAFSNKYLEIKDGYGDLKKEYHTDPELAVSLKAADRALRDLAATHVNTTYKSEGANITGSNLPTLDGLESDGSQPVYYTMDTFVTTPTGGSDDYGLVYVLAVANVFYDFRLTFLNTPDPIVSAAGDETDIEKAKELPGVSYEISPSDKEFVNGVSNGSQVMLVTTQTLTQSVETSSTVTHAQTQTNSTSESYGSDTSMSFTVKFGGLFDGATLGVEETFKYDKTVEETFAVSDSTSTTASQSSSHASTLSVTLPAHSQVLMEQGTGTTTLTLDYDHPVVVDYKAKQLLIGFTVSYSPDGFSVGHTASKCAATFGRDGITGQDLAVHNLRNRVEHYDQSGYEDQFGDGLDWKEILKKDGLKQELLYLSKYLPMSVTGGTSIVSVKSTVSDVHSVQPLYPLRYIKANQMDVRPVSMSTGDVYYPGNVTIFGYNVYDVLYFNFNALYGKWQLLDANGDPVAGNENEVAKLEFNETTKQTSLTAKSESGTVYIKYLIDEESYPEKYGELETVYTKNADLLGTAVIQINVQAAQDQYTVTAAGKVKTRAEDPPINLEDTASGVSVMVLDKNDLQIVVPVVWEAQEAENITIENNRLSVSEPGTYHIRASYKTFQSGWRDVEVGAKRALDEAVLSDDRSVTPVLETALIPANGAYSVDLNGLRVQWLDQDDRAWTGEVTPVWTVTPTAGASVDKSIATFTKAGDYSIRVGSGGVTSNALSLHLVEDRVAQAPVITDQTRIQTYTQYEEVTAANILEVVATVTDSGRLSYRWFVSDTGDFSKDGAPIADSNHTAYAPPTDALGAKWYRCEVTNTLAIDMGDGRTVYRSAKRVSDSIPVMVEAKSEPNLLMGVGETYKTGYENAGISVGDTTVAQVDKDTGVITALKTGETTITFDLQAVKVVYHLRVVEAPTKLAFAAPGVALNPGERYQLAYGCEPVGARKKAVFTSSDEKVVKVNADSGLVTAVAVGQATVTAKSYNSASVVPIQDTCLVTVSELDKRAASVYAAGAISLPEGDSVTFTDLIQSGKITAKVRDAAGVELEEATAKLIWRPNDTGIRVVGDTLTALAENTPADPNYTIVATYGALSSDPLPVVVTPARRLSLIALADKADVLEDQLILSGGTLELNMSKLTVSLADQYDSPWPVNTLLTWHASPDKNATVAGSRITFSAPGVYEIYAKAGTLRSNPLSLRLYEDKAAQAPVITKQPNATVSYNQYTVDAKLTVEASVTDGGALSYQWYAVDGQTVTPIVGAQSASYAPPTVAVGGNTYRCVVTNTLTLPEGSKRHKETASRDILVTIVQPSTGGDIMLGVGESHRLNYGTGARYASSDPSVAEISASGVIKANGNGTTRITVDMPVVTTSAAPTEKGLVIAFRVTVVNFPSDIKLSASEYTLNPGKTCKLSYTLTQGSAGSVAFSSDNPRVATVSDSGLVTAVAEGVAVVTATTYNQKKATCTINVTPFSVDADHIETKGSVTLAKDSTVSLSALIRKGELFVAVRDKYGVELPGALVSYVSNDSGLSVSGDSLTARDQPSPLIGYFTITARYGSIVSKPIKVYVTPARPLDGIALGVKEKLDISGEVSAPSTYETSDKRVATVNKKGVITARKPGTATVTAVTVPTAPSGSVTSQFVINVYKAPKKITLSEKTLTLTQGAERFLTYTLPSGSAGKVTTTVKKPEVASIDAYGRVTALSPGKTKITFKTYNGKKAVCTVTVVPSDVKPAPEASAITALSVSPAALTLGVDEKAPLRPVWTPQSALCEPTRKVEGKSVKLLKDGSVKGVKAGVSAVVFTVGGLEARVDVTVLKKPKTVRLDTKELALAPGQTHALVPAFGQGQGGSVTFACDKPAVATVDAEGRVTAVAPGKATVTVKTYNGKKAKCTVTVA